MDELIETMRYHEHNGDPEDAHGIADTTLLDALRLLATDENREQVEALIEAWNRVPKWYG